MNKKQKILSSIIQINGEIPCVRVSSAQASGAAKKYSYWGAVRYVIRNRIKDNIPISFAEERASSDRRSLRLAYQDTLDISKEENRLVISSIGELSENELEEAIKFTVENLNK